MAKQKYEMNSKLLEEVIEERYLGVIMHINDMKCNSHCIKAVKTANVGNDQKNIYC